MGDEKQYTIQIKGTAYKFKPIPQEDLSMVVLVMNMGVSGTKTLKALAKVLGASAGAEQWDAITDRLIAGEIDIKEITVGLLEKIVKRQGKDSDTADDAE